MDFCHNCGKQIEETELTCPQCGVRKKNETIINKQKIFAYSGFWRRFAAFIVDSILIKMANFILIYIIGGGHFDLPSQIATLALIFLYFAGMESSSYQGTLGKVVLGIKVTDMDGNRISFLRAAGRYFGKIISSIILGIGYLMIAFTDRKQGLHDLMAGCLVIKK